MAARYLRSAIRQTPDVVELSDSDEYSMSDNARTQQDLNNRRLAQAISYLNEEGGDDSPPTFMDRLGRINDALLQQLPQQGRGAFDPELYRTLRAMVQDVRRDFEDARQAAHMPMEIEVELHHFAAPSAAEALYRADSDDDSGPPTPTRAAGPSKLLSDPLPARYRGSDDNVERQRKFKYGGPDNEVENWHKNFPPSLPFPETIKMAHWESLKIDYDLSRPKEDTIVEMDVPFTHPQLLQYKNLPQYESGSRFKLPAVSKELQIEVASEGGIQKVVNAFNDADQSEGTKKDYAPRVALEKLKLGYQLPHAVASPTQIRRALATTPSKANYDRGGSAANMGAYVPFGGHAVIDRDVPGSDALEKSTTGQNRARAGPVGRCIKTAVNASLKDSTTSKRAPSRTPPTRRLTRNTPTPAAKSITRTATDVAIPASRPRGRPRKDSLPTPTPTSASLPSPLPSPVLGKRKASIGAMPYTPDAASLKKALRDTKRQRTVETRKIGFVDPSTLEDEDEDGDGRFRVSKASKSGRKAGRSGTTRSGVKYLL